MINVTKIFGNFYDSALITPDRLLLHAKDHLKRLIKGNIANIFDAEIAILTPLIAVLEDSVSGIDTTQNLQTAQTDDVDVMVYKFCKSMSRLKGVIAEKVGGKDKLAFKEFYPHELYDYTNPSRTEMPIITKRVNKAATKYAAILGVEVTTELQGFQAEYETLRSDQGVSIVDLSTDRTGKHKGVLDVERALSIDIHKIAILFPMDVVKCSGFLNFNLLYTTGHRKHVFYNNTLIIDETAVVANRSLTDSVTIAIRNKCINANIEVWTAATADGLPTLLMCTVAPGKASIVVPSSLGDIDNTFLLVKNASAVNPATYEIETIG